MPITGEGSQSSGISQGTKTTQKTEPAPAAPAQTPPSAGSGGTAGSGGGSGGSGRSGGGGAASATQPGRPAGFGGPQTGWGGSFEDSFVRLNPSAGFTKNSTQNQTSAWVTLTWNTETYNDGIVTADSSGASFQIPEYLANHNILVVGNVEWAGSQAGSRQIGVLETLADATSRRRIGAFVNATNTTGALAVNFSHSVHVGQGSTRVQLVDIQGRSIHGATATASAGFVHFMQVR